MDLRLMAAVSDGVEELNIAEFCRQQGISRQSFYKWRSRYRAGGLEGLEERSRAPRSSPGGIGANAEEAIVALRKELADIGLDAGAGTIQWHLGRRGVLARVPSEATIWRVLVRRGLVVPEPRNRPKASLCRFEAPAPNVLWQIDATKWVVGDHGTQIEIINIVDDHSRVAIASRAVEVTTCEQAWAAFSTGVGAWGLPTGLLSDNGLAFSGRLKGYEVGFEVRLREAGVRAITARPFHPQTCGKVERFQQTLKRWLRAQPLAPDLAALQAQLDAFVAYYNHERPHRAIGRITPAERWAATPPAVNTGAPLPAARRAVRASVGDRGTVRLHDREIHVGVAHTGRAAQVLIDGTHAAVFIDGVLVRHLELDPTRRYQGSGKPRGGPRQPRPALG